MRRNKLVLINVVVTLIVLLNGVVGQDQEIFGCGGFVQSPYPLDFNKIQIKLYTKQGNLKLETESAPTTGYYFMPLDSKGQYVMKISPPEGWTFEPSEYKINFDGVSSDICSEDLNFEFKGFSITGQIQTLGHSEGPSEALLTLTGEDGFFLKTKTKTGGSFSFGSIPPGKYTLRSSHTGATYEKDTHVFEVTENYNVANKITISGYEIKGRVTSDKSGVEGVSLVLLGQSQTKNVQNCKAGKPEGFVLPETESKHVICHQVSDVTGTYRFKNVPPGKYTVVPVYKGANIVYNVSPDRLDVDLKHQSIELGGFEVDGFTVLGSVKGPTEATISVNGQVRAKSDKNGKFSIQKMKAGTYEFDIIAEKFQFAKQTIKITASNPILPEFQPSKFQVCGSLQLVRELVPTTQLSLKFESDDKKTSQVETIVSPTTKLCYFLPSGKYSASIQSSPEKFFVPPSSKIQVPSTAGFEFKEFSGFISGRVLCPLLSKTTLKCEVKVQLLSKSEPGKVIAEAEVKTGTFKFNNLESGQYVLKLTGTNYCWKELEISTQLRDKNVDDLEFVQTGFAVDLTSSHATQVKIVSKQKRQANVLEEVILDKNVEKQLCLKQFSPEGYDLQMTSCHTFESNPTAFKLIEKGTTATKVSLQAIAHEFSGTISSNANLTEFQVKQNGQPLDTKSVSLLDQKDGQFLYNLKLTAKAGESINLNFFSYDFIFEPNTLGFVAGDDCGAGIFEVVAKKSHVVKGKIVPALDGVEIEVELVGSDDRITVTTNSQGEYIAGPFIHTQGFVVTPKLAGYTFKPTGDGYSFNALQWAKIQVRVEEVQNKSPVSPVLLSLSGPSGYRQNRVTDANGEMVFGDLHSGTYFLKALLKEFSFEPSALHIELAEQETKVIKLSAKRESFSMFGKVSTLSGELMPNLMLTAKGIANCSEYGEEGVSDENGNFRIWSLKSFCKYKVSVVKKDEQAQRVERTIPQELELRIGNENVHNITFVVIQPVKRMDISLRVHSKNTRNLESLRALIYSTKSTDSPLFSVPFNGVPYIILPPIPKDGGDYFIVFESTLNQANFAYELPPQINFTAKEAYAHFAFDFNVEPIHHEQDIGKSSYLAFAFMMLVFLVIVNFERLSAYLKEGMDKYLQSSAASAASKRKLKASKSQ